MSTLRILVLAADARITSGSDADCNASACVELGPALANHLQSIPHYDSWWLSVIGDTQLRVEHALHLKHCDVAIFIETRSDAPSDGSPALFFEEISAPHAHHVESADAALSPQDLIHTLRTLRKDDPLPSCFRLSLASGEDSAVPRERLENLVAFIQELLADADLERWREQARRPDTAPQLTSSVD